MFDTHYDLLTIVYTLKDNKKYLKKIIKDLNKNYKGVIANLFFMNKKEMKEELNINNINVLDMFIKSKQILKKYKLKSKILYSIEGCDYIKDSKELEQLTKQGLNAILLVWNNQSKYASGIRTTKGLTKKGEQFIKKAIDLKLGIDLSHANEKTFYDIIRIITKSKKTVTCYASHSNIYNLHNHPRNLKEKQLQALKSVNGKLGIVCYPEFLTNSKEKNKIKENYLKHIENAVKIMGINNVMVSTDNMDFYYQLNNINPPSIPFNQNKIKKEMKKLLKIKFKNKDIKKIMYKNAEKLYKKLSSNIK